MEECEGIVVGRSRWSESSLIVTWVTDRFGTLRTAARGALRPRNAFAGQLDLFTRAEVGFVEARQGSLHALREVRSAHLGGIQTYPALTMASYFSEMAAGLAPPMQPSAEIFDLLSRALDYLRINPPSRRALEHFEREAARLTGVLDPRGGSAPHLTLAQMAGKIPPTREFALRACPDAERKTPPTGGGTPG